MVKRKGDPKKHCPKRQHMDTSHTLIYKGFKFIEVEESVGVAILQMLDQWNAKASEIIPGDEIAWNGNMETKPTHSEQCHGLFVKKGSINQGKLIAFMKGELVISPKDCSKRPASTSYDIQPVSKCVYTAFDGVKTTVHELDCYVRGTGTREPFNGQLCNHTCFEEHQNCRFLNLTPVEISMTTGEIVHTLSLPLIGVETIKEIHEGSECLVNYGKLMLSDEAAEGFIPCKCESCASGTNGKFILV